MFLKLRPKDKRKPHDIHGTYSWSHSLSEEFVWNFLGQQIFLYFLNAVLWNRMQSYDFNFSFENNFKLTENTLRKIYKNPYSSPKSTFY